MGHLNGILARVGGNLNNNFQKSQMPGVLPGGGMLKVRFDRYIRSNNLAPSPLMSAVHRLPHRGTIRGGPWEGEEAARFLEF